MSVAEPQPAVPKPKLRWYQFSLRTLLVCVTLASVLCSIGVCLGWRVTLAVVVFATFFGGGLVDGHRGRRVYIVFVPEPRWLSILLNAILSLLAAYGGIIVLFLTGTVFLGAGDPYSLLLTIIALSSLACVCYTLGRRMTFSPPTTDAGAFVGSPFRLALAVFACINILISVFRAAIGL